MGYGSSELVAALLDAGAPMPESDHEDCLVGSGCHCPSGGMFNGTKHLLLGVKIY